MGSVAVDVLPGVGNVGFKSFVGDHGITEIPDKQASPCGKGTQSSDSEAISLMEKVFESDLCQSVKLFIALTAVYPEVAKEVLTEQMVNDLAQMVSDNKFSATTDEDTAESEKLEVRFRLMEQKIERILGKRLSPERKMSLLRGILRSRAS